MSLTAYLVGAWLTACLSSVMENMTPTRNVGMAGNMMAAVIVSLAWPLVALIYVGMLIRRWALR